MLIIQQGFVYSNYYLLLQYASKICDAVTLKIPNHNKLVINEKNHAGNLDLEIGHSEVGDDPLFEIYYDNATRLVDKLFEKHIIKTSFDTQYVTTISSTESKNYIMQMSQELAEILDFAGSLFAWKFPFLPEDLCFFYNGKCWLQSIAHEEICWIYDDSNDVQALLKRMKIKYTKEKGEDIPLLM